MRWLICAMVSWRLRSWKASITASPRASEVMKVGSPLSSSMRRAGESGSGGDRAGGEGGDSSSFMGLSLRYCPALAWALRGVLNECPADRNRHTRAAALGGACGHMAWRGRKQRQATPPAVSSAAVFSGCGFSS
ncbi:hypothetical protein D3C75_904920 [compost metagenome]